MYGQSSGGTAIFALLSSPSSAGLFHRAISLSGSPHLVANLSVAVTQASRMPYYPFTLDAVVDFLLNRVSFFMWQNRVGWLANTPCAGSTDVFTCINGLSSEEVYSAIPPLWSPVSYFPTSPAGNNYPALAIVDGVTGSFELPSVRPTEVSSANA